LYKYVFMSILFFEGTTELLILHPKEFRRVYTLDKLDTDDWGLKYSHSDVVVHTESGAPAMIEIVQGLLCNGNYTVKMMPTGATFKLQHTQGGTESTEWLKKLIFMNFPDLKTGDYYCNNKLRSNN